MMKKCNQCNEVLGDSLFYKRLSSKDGLDRICKKCSNENSRIWKLNHPGWNYENSKRWHENNREKVAKKGRERNKIFPEKKRIANRKWQEKNGYKKSTSNVKNRAIHKCAIVKWSNEFYIEEIYRLAKLRSKITGIEWHVDHVIPLRGKLVCGLHVETNLQVIPAIINLRKGRKFEV